MTQLNITSETKVSEHGFVQDIIAEQAIKGGLNVYNRTQKVIFRYKRKTDMYCAKAEITHGIAKDIEFEYIANESPKSLRFSAYGEIFCFWANLTKLMVVFGRKTGMINPQNYEKKLKDALETVERTFRLNMNG